MFLCAVLIALKIFAAPRANDHLSCGTMGKLVTVRIPPSLAAAVAAKLARLAFFVDRQGFCAVLAEAAWCFDRRRGWFCREFFCNRTIANRLDRVARDAEFIPDLPA
jgi:hypothetical protein